VKENKKEKEGVEEVKMAKIKIRVSNPIEEVVLNLNL
jgi:hypothetical protein